MPYAIDRLRLNRRRTNTSCATSSLIRDYSSLRVSDLEDRLRRSEETSRALAQQLRARQAATDDEQRVANLADDAAQRTQRELENIAKLRRSNPGLSRRALR